MFSKNPRQFTASSGLATPILPRPFLLLTQGDKGKKNEHRGDDRQASSGRAVHLPSYRESLMSGLLKVGLPKDGLLKADPAQLGLAQVGLAVWILGAPSVPGFGSLPQDPDVL